MDNSRQLPAMVRTDHGEANRRILAKETPADFRRVEAAAITRRTSLHSAEGKRLFVRFFYTLQSRVYYISTIGRTRKSHDEIEALEAQIKEAISQANKSIDRYMGAVEQRLKEASIDTFASFTTVPMEEDVAIVSAIGRRYFELLHRLDQLMPLLQTLEIEELVTETELDRIRAKVKRIAGRPASVARLLADRLRSDMRDLPPGALEGASGESGESGESGNQTAAAGIESVIEDSGPALPSPLSAEAPTLTGDPDRSEPQEPTGTELPPHRRNDALTVTRANGTAW